MKRKMKYRILRATRNLKEIKPNFLKTSYLKSKIAEIFFERNFRKYKKNFKNRENGKVLIITMEALGDNVVKTTSLKKIAEFYGKENIYIMCRDKWESVFIALGYNVLGLKRPKNPFKNAKYRMEFFRNLNEIGFEKVILFEHIGLGDILKYILCENTVGLCSNDKSPYLKQAIKVDDDRTYTLDRQILLMEKIMDRKYTREDLRPDMREMFYGKDKKYFDIITIGIGASSEKKVLPIERMSEILNYLGKRYSTKKLCLLGAGKKQEEYVIKLLDRVEIKNIESYVGKVSLLETINLVNDSDFFLGYDSGLSNIAFALRKKYICLFWTKMAVWQHPFEDVKIILGDEISPTNDGYHGNDILNSITIKQVEKALSELEL